MDSDAAAPTFDMSEDIGEECQVNIYSSLVRTYRKNVLEPRNFLEFIKNEEKNDKEHTTTEEFDNIFMQEKETHKTKNKKSKPHNKSLENDEEISVISCNIKNSDKISAVEEYKIPPGKKNSSYHKFNRQTQKILKNLERKKQNFYSTDVSSNASDVICCDELSTESDCICINDIQEDDDYIDKYITVKIKCNESLIKVTMERDQKFSTVFPEIASQCLVPPSCILLCFNDIMINPQDTPDSLQMTFADILECYIKKSNSELEWLDKNSISIQIQSSDTRKKTLIKIQKDQPLSEMMQKYSKLKEIPLKKLLFKFDGDAILPSETADDLDMEDGSCIDVIISS